PATGSSSLIPTGSPPNGSEVSARRAASSAPSGSRYEKQLRLLFAIAASVASSSSRGDRSPRRNASTSAHASPVQGSPVTTAIMPSSPSGSELGNPRAVCVEQRVDELVDLVEVELGGGVRIEHRRVVH